MRPNALESQKFLWKTPVLNDKHSLLVLTPILWLAPNNTKLLAVVQLSDFHTSSVVYACISWWAAGLFSSAFRASAREIKSPEQAYSLQEQHSFQLHTSPSPCLWRARILKETKGQFIRKKVRTLGHLTHLFRARSMFYLTSYTPSWGLLRWLSGKESSCKAGDMGSIPGLNQCRRNWQSTQVFFLGKSHGQKSLEGYSPWGLKESDMTEHTYTHTPRYSGRMWNSFCVVGMNDQYSFPWENYRRTSATTTSPPIDSSEWLPYKVPQMGALQTRL